MDLKRHWPQLILIALFFVVNAFFVLNDMPVLYYPNTAFLFFVALMGLFFYQDRNRSAEESGFKVGNMQLTLTESVPQQRLMDELDMAKRVQEGLLSLDSPEIPGFKIVKKCVPAASVGGDFYNFVSQDFTSLAPKEKSTGIVEYFDQHDTHLGLVIGDVAGHGVSSALIMALSSGLLNEVGNQFSSTEKILRRTNTKLLRFIENSQITHVTVFYGILNLSNLEFTYSRAGHPPALLQHQDGSIEELDTEGVFLGMFNKATFEEKTTFLSSGDRLFLYTDGINETRGQAGEMFGLDRLKAVIEEYRDRDIEDVKDLVFEAVDYFSNHAPAKDDRSLVILEVT